MSAVTRRSFHVQSFSCALLFVAALAVSPAGAATKTAFSVTGPFSWGEWDATLGWVFKTYATLKVTDLGFNDDGVPGNYNAHPVGIWTNSGTLLGSATVGAGAGNPQYGNYRYASLGSPITLAKGGQYVIGVQTYKPLSSYPYSCDYSIGSPRTSSGGTYTPAWEVSWLQGRSHTNTTTLTYPERTASSLSYLCANFLFQRIATPLVNYPFAPGQNIEDDGWTTDTGANGSVGVVVDPLDGSNHVLELSDTVGDPVSIYKGLPFEEAFTVDFGYMFNDDSAGAWLKLYLTDPLNEFGDILLDRIHAPASGPGMDSYGRYTNRFTLQNWHLPVGDYGLKIELTNTGDPVMFMDDLSITTMPEPATMSLLALGGLALLRRRKK